MPRNVTYEKTYCPAAWNDGVNEAIKVVEGRLGMMRAFDSASAAGMVTVRPGVIAALEDALVGLQALLERGCDQPPENYPALTAQERALAGSKHGVVEAIKMYRQRTGNPLKVSHDVVKHYQATGSPLSIGEIYEPVAPDRSGR